MPSEILQNINQVSTPAANLKPDYSTVLSFLEPDLYPLDTMTRQLKARGPKAKQVYVNWGAVDSYPRTDAITTNAAAGEAGAAQTWYIDNASMWRKNDIIHIPSLGTASPAYLVTSVSTSSMTVINLGVRTTGTGWGTVAAIEAGTVIAWVGSALYDGSAPSDPRASSPYWNGNYCEISDHVVSITKTRENTENWGGQHDWVTAQKEQLKEFRRSLEYKKFFGKASKTTDATATTRERWTMNGVTQYITKIASYNKNATNGQRITEVWLLDTLAELFGGNNGSETRILFADTFLLTELDKVPLAALRNRTSVNVLGCKVSKVEFDLGTLYIKHHRGFNEMGYTHFGVALDMEQIKSRDLLPMEKVTIDYRTTTGALEKAEQYMEQSTLQVDKPDAHQIWQGITVEA